MAFDKETLTGWGIPEDKAEAIIAQHDEVIYALKAQVEEAEREYNERKAQAEALPGLKAELEALKAGEEWKAKYEAEKAAFDSFKAECEAKEEDARKREAYGRIMWEMGIPWKSSSLVEKAIDTSSLRLDEAGNLNNPEAVKVEIAREWGSFIPAQKGVKK